MYNARINRQLEASNPAIRPLVAGLGNVEAHMRKLDPRTVETACVAIGQTLLILALNIVGYDTREWVERLNPIFRYRKHMRRNIRRGLTSV